MNQIMLMGRLTRDPQVNVNPAGNQTITRFTLAVDRRRKVEGQQNTDFPSIVCFGKIAEFAQNYLKQGIRVIVRGRLQTGSYVNRENQRIYTTDVIAEDITFVDSKSTNEAITNRVQQPQQQAAGFTPGNTPVQTAPVQQTTPVQQTPARQTAPVQQAPVQQTPVQQFAQPQTTPVQQTPVQQAPVQQAPVQQQFTQPQQGFAQQYSDEFMSIPEGIDEDLPFA